MASTDPTPSTAQAASPEAESNSLRQAIAGALTTQQERRPGEWSSALQQAIAVNLPEAIRATVSPSYGVKGSAGFGNNNEIPWVAVMPPGVRGASEGEYVVYLFTAGGEHVYLCLSQAVTGRKVAELPRLATDLRARAGDQPDLLQSINLDATTSKGRKYELATAYAIRYTAGAIPDEAELENDLHRFLELLDAAEPPTLGQGQTADIDNGLNTTETESGPRVWSIYVPRSGAENLGIARRHRVWGAPETGRLSGVRAGDEVVFVQDMVADGAPRAASFPRVQLDDFHGVAQSFVIATVTENPYHDDTPIWPDAEYPERFRFREESEQTGVLIDAQTYPPDFREALRRSANSGSRPMLLPGYTTLLGGFEEPDFDQVVDGVRNTGLRISDDVLRRYHLSLKTRGFVILSGLSGSGKTWLTEAYAQAAGACYLLQPVAPNWTTNEDLLGYYNPLTEKYVDTPFSTFLRQAAAESERAELRGRTAVPYHLVLDEMNLARVEYYFAKFLSTMEVRARGGPADVELQPGERVKVGPNLMFIGTVNVDETTHGFADKVYDRAQLIELSVTRQDLKEHLGDVAYAETVLAVWDTVQALAPFAYRTLDEMSAYIAQAAILDVPWQKALDEQLVQKVLPKLKGANPKIDDTLTSLLAASDIFPLTRAKAQRMLDDYRRFGFTSYF